MSIRYDYGVHYSTILDQALTESARARGLNSCGDWQNAQRLMSEFIARRRLFTVDRNGRHFDLTIAVGKPYEISLREWACPVKLSNGSPAL